MRNNKSIALILLIGIVLLISACQSDTPPSLHNSSYPITDQNVEQAKEFTETSYPINDNEDIFEETSLEIPLPTVDTGVVYGNLMSLTINESLSYSKIYLGSRVDVDTGDKYIISISDHLSPHGVSTKDGNFLISNIPLGRYFLILVTPIGSYSVLSVDGSQIELTIEGGESIDLNQVFVNWPDFD